MAADRSTRFHPTRRGVLKAALWSAGALSAPALVASQSLSSVGLPLRVGVALPHASRYAPLGPNLLAGMRLFLAEAARGGSPAITLIPAAYTPGLSSALTTVQELIGRSAVNLVVGAFDAQTAAHLRPTLEAAAVPLLAVEPGANIVRPEAHSPLIAYHTLGAWQSSWALGDWAARAVGRRAVVLASCYESGYDALYTFELGFTAAGGTVVRTHVTHVPGRADDLPTLLGSVAKLQPDAIVALYSGAEAAEVVRAYAASPLAGRVPLLGSGFLASEAAGVVAAQALPWSPALPGAVSRAFSAAFTAATGQVPDSFAALGYDAARQLVEAARRSDRASHLPEALAAVEFDGVRGRFSVDAATRVAAAPLFLHAGGAPAALPAVSLQHEGLAAFVAEPRTGWLYPYLVA